MIRTVLDYKILFRNSVMTIATALMSVSTLASIAAAQPRASKVNNKERMMTQATTAAAPADSTVRPFKVNFPDAALEDLRQRVKATKFPEQETVNDDTQ